MTHPSTAMIGLGRMGSALAGALAEAGVPLTVWNRNPSRAYAFEGRARVARSATEACSSAELVVVVAHRSASYAAYGGLLTAAAALLGYGG